MMKRVLVISWFYPPINSSEGVVTYKLLKNSDLEYDVCTQEDKVFYSYGKDTNFPDLKNVHAIYINSKTLAAWGDEVTKYFRDHREEYDIVMTRSMPPESHIIGMNIKNIKPSVTWIASFGDPIANNPYDLKRIKEKGLSFLKKWYLKIRLWRRQALETKIIKGCDFMIMNNMEQKEYMLKSYEEYVQEKAIVLPHSFDEELYTVPVSKEECGKKKIVFIGHLDDVRTPHVFLKALKELNEQLGDLKDRIEVLFYGDISAKDKRYLTDNDLLSIVTVKGPVSYLESLKIMAGGGNWLLHIDANLHSVMEHNIFFAAKLADYIGSGTPIMGITMSEGASADILRELDALVMSYSVEEIKNYLYLILYEDYKISMNAEAADRYNAKTVAKQFDRLIRKLQ